MDAINTNLSSLLIQLNQMSLAGGVQQGGFMPQANNVVGQDAAVSYMPGAANRFENFDSMMDKFAMFNDMIATAQGGISQMVSHGESIRDLVAKAKEEGVTEETLNAIQAEVDARIAEIGKIRENTSFNGVNPFNTAFSLSIPNWQELFGISGVPEVAEGEDAENNVLASISFDMTIDGENENGAYSIGASATINIGVNEDGALEITVDASMDFDLSGLSNGGVQSDNAFDIINNFLAMLTGKQNDLGMANSIMDSLFAKASATIEGDGFSISADNNVNLEQSSSNSLKGQIVQHASITLDSSANQSPNIAINIL
ncbi:hypothetical protein IKQ21_08335 [bacterium]|nr:hypothetical protein [bacterium]